MVSMSGASINKLSLQSHRAITKPFVDTQVIDKQASARAWLMSCASLRAVLSTE